MSIITFGLDPLDSKLVTFGYGPEYTVEIVITPKKQEYIGGIPGTPFVKKTNYNVLISIKKDDEILWSTEEYELDYDKIYDYIVVNMDINDIQKQLEKVIYIDIKESFEKDDKTNFKISLKPIIESNTDGEHEDSTNRKSKFEIRLKD